MGTGDPCLLVGNCPFCSMGTESTGVRVPPDRPGSSEGLGVVRRKESISEVGCV